MVEEPAQQLSDTTAVATEVDLMVANPVLTTQRPIQPLNQFVFRSVYAKWCSSKGILQMDEVWLVGRPMKLYQLHACVARAGWSQRVSFSLFLRCLETE